MVDKEFLDASISAQRPKSFYHQKGTGSLFTLLKIKSVLVKDFSKFTFVGLFWTIVNIFLMYVLIDLLKMPGWIGSTIVVGIAFILRYYHLIYIKLIKKAFIKYAVANVAFSLLTVILMSLFVDILGLPSIFVSPPVIGGLFLLKFFAFHKIGIMRNPL